MADEPGGLHDISFEQWFPWLRLFRGVGVATDSRKLILAALGLIVFSLGRAGLDRLFPRTGPVTWTMLPVAAPLMPMGAVPALGDWLSSSTWRLTEPVRYVVGPFVELFRIGIDGKRFLHASLLAVWGVAVWGIIGGAIARIAVVQVTRV